MLNFIELIYTPTLSKDFLDPAKDAPAKDGKGEIILCVKMFSLRILSLFNFLKKHWSF